MLLILYIALLDASYIFLFIQSEIITSLHVVERLNESLIAES